MVKTRAKKGRLGGVLKRPRVFVALAFPLAIPLFIAAVRSQPELGGPVEASLAPPPHVKYAELQRPHSADLPEHSLVLTVEKNDTLDKLLTAGGLSRGESALLTHELAKSIDVRRLRPGQLVRFHYDRTGVVDAVQMKVTGWGELSAVRNGSGFDVTAQQAVVREVETAVSATIDRSLYEALRQQGEGPQLVQQLIDVFQWDIDFFELRKGDEFSLVVTKQYAGADLLGYGAVKAARFTHRGTTYEAFRHDSPDGRAGYYGASGTPLRKQVLKAPLKFTRVTSGFTKKRFHPVLKYFRPHYGVDYGAPTGTPVMSTADGVVVEARYKPGEGNMIRVRHSSRYDTCYLHLSRFAKGLKKGSKVTQGDVIGYVGMTGLASGPHLHYEYRLRGVHKNPQTVRLPDANPIAPALRDDFVRQTGPLIASLELVYGPALVSR